MTIQSPVRAAFEVPDSTAAANRASANTVRFIDVPVQRFLAVDGSGAPGDPLFREAMSALYPVAFTLHFGLKERGISAPMGSLEGLYWTNAGPALFEQPGQGSVDVNAFQWRLMLPVPPSATATDVETALAHVAATRAPAAISRVRVETVKEGPCVQLLHIGPYDAEQQTLERLHEAIAQAGLRPHGAHHEIYISDPNRTPAQRLKTVIRQPVTDAAMLALAEPYAQS